MASLGLEVKALSFIITNAYCHLDNILYILLNNIIFSPTVATLDVKHFSHYQMIGLFPCFKQTFRHQPQDYIFFLLISNFSFYQQWQNIFRWCSELQQAKSKLGPQYLRVQVLLLCKHSGSSHSVWLDKVGNRWNSPK